MKVILFLLFLSNLSFAHEANYNDKITELNSQIQGFQPSIEENGLEESPNIDSSNLNPSEIAYWTF